MEKEIKKDDQTIFYTDEGNGLPVFLLHGFCEDLTIWNDFKQPLLGYCRVITPDLPGFGKSTLAPGGASIDNMAESVKAIVDKEAINQFALVGHSMGGYVALAYAEKYPQDNMALCLFHSTCFADDEAKKENRIKVAGFVLKNGSSSFVKELYGTLFTKQFVAANQQLVDNLIKYASSFQPAAISNASLAMGRRPDRSQVLKQAKQPVLFIIGRFDMAIPFDRSMKMVPLTNSSDIRILEDTAHMGMIEEKSETQKILKEWTKLVFKSITLFICLFLIWL